MGATSLLGRLSVYLTLAGIASLVASCSATAPAEAACGVGYTREGQECVDADECGNGSHDCAAEASCVNRPGGFECRCPNGYVGDGRVCRADTCTDSSECGENAQCSGVADARLCRCLSGYVHDGTACVDVDECAEGSAACDANATCSNADGGFGCACNQGFVGDGFDCAPSTACTDGTHNCDANATCTPEGGGFSCACNPGYSGDGSSCELTDACAAGLQNCDSHATCTPVGSTFSCGCNQGYVGDGVRCEVLDAKTWYVDCDSGSDAATGHAPNDALKSLAAVNARLQQTPLAGGHALLLKRGVTCRGALTLAFAGGDAFAAPVVIGAYGDVAAGRAEITGAVPITNAWTLVPAPAMNGVAIPYLAGAPIYRVPAGVDVKQLFVGGERKPIASWEDAWSDGDMLRGTQWSFPGGGTGSFHFPRQQPLTYGTTPGHEVLIRTKEWYWSKRPIVAVNAQTQIVTFEDSALLGYTVSHWGVGAGSSLGVELRNALNLVGADGDWAFNTATRELHTWSNRGDPGLLGVEASTGGTLLYADTLPSAATLEVRDLALTRAGGDGVHLWGTGNVVLSGVQVEDANEVGIRIDKPAGAVGAELQSVKISGCTVNGSNGFGIQVRAARRVEIVDNVLHENGRLGTQSEVGNSISSVKVGGSDFLIEGNRITDSGYAAVAFWYGGEATIRGNYIHNSCVHLNDCGALYTNGQNQPASARLLIENNFIRRSIPSMRATNWALPDGKLAAGVYLDHQASHATIRNNAMLNHEAATGAVLINGGSYNTVDGNTVYATTWPNLGVYCQPGQVGRPQENVAGNNVFYTQSVSRANVHLFDYCSPPIWNTGDPKMLKFGATDRFLNPLNAYVLKKVGANVSELGTWSPSDHMIHFFYTTANRAETFANVRLLVNETFVSKSVDLDTIYCDADGTQVQGTVALSPLSARVLVKCGCNGDGVQNNLETVATCGGY